MIELLVAVSIGIVMMGFGIISVSKFLTREHVTTAKSEVISAVKMARNYAITAQPPDGFADGQLDYIMVTIDANKRLVITARNLTVGVGTSYYAKVIGGDDVTITTSGNILFSIPEGKLLINGSTPADSAYAVTVNISSKDGTAGPVTVSVDAGGKIW